MKAVTKTKGVTILFTGVGRKYYRAVKSRDPFYWKYFYLRH